MTGLLLLAALAHADDAQPDRPWSAGLAVEYDLVGGNVGPVLDGLWFPGHQRVHAVRIGVGALPGPEYLYVPLAVGWRMRTGPEAPHLHGLFGVGVNEQLFVISDAPTVARPIFYGELGAAWSVKPHLDLGLLVVPELTWINVPGIGLGLRLGAWLR